MFYSVNHLNALPKPKFQRPRFNSSIYSQNLGITVTNCLSLASPIHSPRKNSLLNSKIQRRATLKLALSEAGIIQQQLSRFAEAKIIKEKVKPKGKDKSFSSSSDSSPRSKNSNENLPTTSSPVDLRRRSEFIINSPTCFTKRSTKASLKKDELFGATFSNEPMRVISEKTMKDLKKKIGQLPCFRINKALNNFIRKKEQENPQSCKITPNTKYSPPLKSARNIARLPKLNSCKTNETETLLKVKPTTGPIIKRGKKRKFIPVSQKTLKGIYL